MIAIIKVSISLSLSLSLSLLEYYANYNYELKTKSNCIIQWSRINLCYQRLNMASIVCLYKEGYTTQHYKLLGVVTSM